MDKVQPFPNAASRNAFVDLAARLRGEPALPEIAPPPEASMPPVPKIGLYPLGEDILMSRALYQIILLALERGAEADRARVAEMMRLAELAPYTM